MCRITFRQKTVKHLKQELEKTYVHGDKQAVQRLLVLIMIGKECRCAMLLNTPDSQEKIVMLKYTVSFANVLRCRLDGSFVWRAELPARSNDVYTNIEWREQELYAVSRSCASVWLDETRQDHTWQAASR